MSNDYFSQEGFIIDGQCFTREAARYYLINTWCMDAADCERYLNRMVRDYMNRVKATMPKGVR
ncbi:hypothetical protein [Pseudoflavonifractor phocaeensis]|uniref:hypothetical protein n=1 Tax=Pseudoflavonifractor phocaeensis TaxID=1870988 RepID=UPI001959DCBF|nr:hypothetical protein [Pseudoflavonifractor phocaeensis]MBM6927601.1 hypothetical protein [Pseudoflavonifractor phocaeensis]